MEDPAEQKKKKKKCNELSLCNLWKFTWRMGGPNPDKKCAKGLASVIMLFCEASMTHTT